MDIKWISTGLLVTGATGFIGSRVVDVVNSDELFTAIAAVICVWVLVAGNQSEHAQYKKAEK